jgi:N-acetylglucosaminyl-diphospho-decaprenol L-rhamnosyltransferase
MAAGSGPGVGVVIHAAPAGSQPGEETPAALSAGRSPACWATPAPDPLPRTGADLADIAVIIVNYGTAGLALEAAASVLERAHPGHRVELHLVDNASPSGDAETIAGAIAARGWTGRLTFHAEAVNHGFGRGNNVVLSELAARPEPPDYVFLLNPDATLENETIAILADFLDAHPQAACAGAGIRKPGDPAPVTAAFRFPSLGSIFSEAVNFGPVSRLLKRYRVALEPTPEAARVDWVAGAAVIARLSAWRDVGFFDPAYFLYYEEVDLMLQTARAGWTCWYVPEACVVHHEGAATGVRSGGGARRRRPAYLYESWRHYFSKNHGRAYALAGAGLWLLGGTLGLVVAALYRRPALVPLNYAGDILGRVIWPLLRPQRR